MSTLDNYNDPKYWEKVIQAIRVDRYSFHIKQFFYNGPLNDTTTLTLTE